MAFENDQNESALPVNGNSKRKSQNHLPRFYRTQANTKFLSSTLDQLIQPGVVEKINGYVGRKTSKAFNPKDNYVGDVSSDRENYQLEPASIIKDDLGNVTFYKDYNDYVNQLRSFFNQNVDHSVINSQEYYAWEPHIDWDKFINFREYYWLPSGPQSISVKGNTIDVESSITVKIGDNQDNNTYLFSTFPGTNNPTLTLYRGQTYKFEIDTPNLPFTIKTKRTLESGFDLDSSSILVENGVDVQNLEKGVSTFILGDDVPDTIYYVAANDIDAAGTIIVKDIEEATFINVDEEILGKRFYKTSNGFSLSNGMKINFIGDVEPAKYATGDYYVEGVGTAIRLISEKDLNVPSAFTDDIILEFDAEGFDRLPYSRAIGYPTDKDYFIINRSANDGNLWSRYNRWFHKSVIETAASENNQPVEIDQSARAKRPIIEFASQLKLFNFGTKAKQDVDLIDDYTTDVFSIIEGSTGYNVDGIDIAEGMRILFTADTDILVNGRIFEVEFINHNVGGELVQERQIYLKEVGDTQPLENEVVLVSNGVNNKGKLFYYNGTSWVACQDKTQTNQPPLFDLFDDEGNSYSDLNVYPASNFGGNKIFSYKEGTGSADTELGIALSYRSIENVGDIVFDFNLLSDSFTYTLNNQIFSKNSDIAYLRKYTDRLNYDTVNGWQKAEADSDQPVIRQYVFDNTTVGFEIDVYDNSALLEDLWIRVYKNNTLVFEGVDYTLQTNVKNNYNVVFNNDLNLDDVIIIKTKSSAKKNDNGFYELPINVERNPNNDNLLDFTLGEVNDHVGTIVEGTHEFVGVYPGIGNLRDIGPISKFGRRFVQHSAPTNLSLYHILDKDSNIVNAIRFARREYAKFKRSFITEITNLGIDKPVVEHFDEVMKVINRDKTDTMPFYFSDMIALGAVKKNTYTVIDSDEIFFALSAVFNLTDQTRKSVLVYKNNVQLAYGVDYTFNTDGFCVITADKAVDDIINIYEYENTNGSYVPPTPTKLGLYPKYVPQFIIDNTYQPYINSYTPTNSNKTRFAITDLHKIIPDNLIKVYIEGALQTSNYTIDRSVDEDAVIFGTPIEANDTVTIEYPKVYIQGHDGSRIFAYNDYRDDLIFELERRIFNNIKVEYDTSLFDIHDFISGEFRQAKITRHDANKPMLKDFLEWANFVETDYTAHTFFERENKFTFNYKNLPSITGSAVPGYWRQIYKEAFDTDRPHTHPWEMLGFSIEPSWWVDVYGPAPYTYNNEILWSDIEAGIVREPGKKLVFLEKYKRPGIKSVIPVDASGNLLSPIDKGYITQFDSSMIDDTFVFGDGAPAESAWRNSAEFPFALLTSMVVNCPSKAFATGFDRIRQVKNLADQIVYKETNKRINLKNIVFPNTSKDTTQVYTAGLTNYIANYMSSDVLTSYVDYKSNIRNLTNQIGFKLGGFTDKDKFKLILDSRTPTNQGNVFIPDENYKIFLNTSSPIQTVSYSGVIIEKRADGFVVKGYDKESAEFNYFQSIATQNDPSINIGGISEPYLTWNENKTYTVGQNVENQGSYFRVKETHVSGNTFDNSKFAKLASLPLIGGRNAFVRKRFSNTVLTLSYGTLLPKIQDVIDFLLGYGEYLESIGFVFDYFEGNEKTVFNWRHSVNEFLFWTTQNWAEGSVLTLSPAANQLKFQTEYSSVDNIFDSFYGYTLFKADGKKLVEEFSSLGREPNTFVIKPKNTEDGIYAVRLPVVQTEHVCLIDNKTVFGDVIYDLQPGYRQERIKILGYKTDEWDGSLNIPGFIYDNVIINEWEAWQDYSIGDVVKYKEFYYSAKNKIPGEATFTASKWARLDDKPEAGLYANFDYRTNQFADFYDLDSDNFDVEQQKLAQHLIGYQKRDYLENIVNDSVSQYKFYQGYIQDKGTQNALTKLFDVLSSADKDSLEFYEEWAIKDGQVGAAKGFDEVEYILDESKFRLTPQPIELVNSLPAEPKDLVYRILPYETYVKNDDYDHSPFPGKNVLNTYIKNAGYVNQQDVRGIVAEYVNITDFFISQIRKGDYVWVANEDRSWSVYKHVDSDYNITDIEQGTDEITVTVNKTVTDLNVNDVIGISDLYKFNAVGDISSTTSFNKINFEEFVVITKILNNKITFSTTTTIEDTENITGQLSKFVKVRASTPIQANEILQKTLDKNDYIWIDDDNTGAWSVLKNNQSFVTQERLYNGNTGLGHSFGNAISVDNRNATLAVGAPDYENGKVYIYNRPSNSTTWIQTQTIEPEEFADPLERFGASVSLTPDAQYLFVGSPNASNVKTKFEQNFNRTTNYVKGSIVKDNQSLWQATVDIQGELDNILFDPFASTTQAIETLSIESDSTQQGPVLLVGNYAIDTNTGLYAFPNTPTTHFLIRAPKEMYEGSGVGDEIRLAWNEITYSNQGQSVLVAKQPFNGDFPLITNSYLEDLDKTIQNKIDIILYFSSATNIPVEGEILQTTTGSGTVAYVYSDAAETVIYLKDVNGSFNLTDSLFKTNGDFIGEYETQAPIDSVDTSDVWGGYWMVKTGVPYTPTTLTTNTDEGKGLVIYDVIPDSTATGRYYVNTFDNVPAVTSSQNTIPGYIRVLSFTGSPGPGGISGSTLSDKFVVRASKQITDGTLDTVTAGDEIYLYVNQLPRYGVGIVNDLSSINLTTTDTNKKHTVVDVWDGYINFDFTKFTSGGLPFEPRVGLTVRDRTQGGTAEVAFYQRNGLNVTIFVKNKVGNWSEGDDFGQNAEIEFLGVPGDPDPIYQVDRIMGQIQYTGLGFDSANIGKLIVLQAQDIIPVPALDYLSDAECWFYKKEDTFGSETVEGIARAANVPSPTNNEWTQVYKIPTDLEGTVSGLTNQGMFAVYIRSKPGVYDFLSGYTVPEQKNNFYLGSQIVTSKYNDLYRAFIHATGTEMESDPGRIYMLKNGIENGIRFAWDYAKNKKFKGAFNDSINYFTGDIVYIANPADANTGTLYTSKTNIAPGAFDSTDWTSTDDLIDYVGYIPNDTSQSVVNDSTDGSTVLDQGALYKFGTSFDVSKNGDVLIASALYDNDKPNKVVVYRANNGHFERSQEILASDNTIGFGQSIAISDDGMFIAVGAPYNDDVKLDQGQVFVYKQISGQFELYQTLNSYNNERAEMFGWKVDFDGGTLAVSARNADSYFNTTFDGPSVYAKNTAPVTYFDGGFTSFRTTNDDSGVVYLYENYNNTLIFAQTIQLADPEINYFGRNLLLKDNHVYVGLPKLSQAEITDTQGQVVDFRRPSELPVWTIHRQEKQSVDISKIKKVFLYNKEDKELITYLDFIDPLQGKIAGEAEQNIRFKTSYDPATYTTVSAADRSIIIDDTNGWGKEYVGQVWWDLSTAKFLLPYQDTVIFSTQNWNVLSTGNSIDVYEWVQSDVLPSVWDTRADTNEYFPKGYSGTSLYGDNIYSTKREYDSVSQSFKTKYYFWVKNKKITPNVEFRTLNITDIASYIEDPAGAGYRFMAFISPTQFVLYNCDDLIKGKDVALSVQFYTIEKQDQNIHNQYQIISAGLETSLPKDDIVNKWFDSLIGYDVQSRPVPDPYVSEKYRYGILNNPRQGWFINKTEALKQFIERTNLVLKQNLIIDDKIITPLFANEVAPSAVLNLYDTTVDSVDDLAFVGIARAERAELTPVVNDGKITRVIIANAGRGYRTAPTVTVSGKGEDAVITTSIDSQGKVTGVTIENSGSNYDVDTLLTVRRFSVLVSSDVGISGKWAIYERLASSWNRIRSQSYDTSLYWDYIDWYSTGYSDLTSIDFVIDNAYELNSIDVAIGNKVKINNIGSGGWLLLEKIQNEDTTDYTINYKTIGRENGTIEFSSKLYDVLASNVGYDTISFDSKIYDNEPTIELRVILDAIRNNLFIDDLQIEFNNLFFASLRYVFAEQKYVDWAFKTSFIKAVHNVGSLRKDITFNNDNLPSYEAYIEEVKPFGTKIREYLSSYDGLENTQSVVTDFDLAPVYKDAYKTILPESVKVFDGTIIGTDANLETYPNKHWLDNLAYKIVRVEVTDPGEGYLSPPVIEVEGNAILKSYLGKNGTLTSVGVIDGGSNYISPPNITINGNLRDGGKPAKLSVVLGDSPVRSMHTVVKFDRTTGIYLHANIDSSESFVGSGNIYDFDLKWPMNLNKDTVTVTVNGIELLDSEYNYTNINDTSKGYTRQVGRIEFTEAPAVGVPIAVTYKKSVNLFQAQDRINHYYNPTVGMPGKDLSQLMQGIDYGGVEVKSFGFGGPGGWDGEKGWGEGTWDTTYDTSYEDEIYTIDEDSTTVFTFNTPLEASTVYNVYKNGIRIDDPDYGGSPTNPNAVMLSITGNGETGWTRTDDNVDSTGLIVFNEEEISFDAGDEIIFRKSTSDGTFDIDPTGYDTILTGGNLSYTTATGLRSEDITVDGDGFVTPTTSAGPEELIPGQVLDTVDIQVYERPKGGASQITSRVYVGDGSTTTFGIGTGPILKDDLFVKIDYRIISSSDYTIDYAEKTITFETAPTNGERINIVTLGVSGSDIIDIDEFTADGSTVEFLTNVRFTDTLDYYITLNGEKQNNVIYRSDETYAVPNNVVIKLPSPPEAGSKIRFAFFEKESIESVNVHSEVLIDNFTADGSTTSFELSQTPFSQNPTQWFTVVKVNNKILNAGYNKRHEATAGQLEFKIDEWQFPAGTVRAGQIKVFINNEEKQNIVSWDFVGSASSSSSPGQLVRFIPGTVINDGDVIDIYVLSDGEYNFGTFDGDFNFTETPGILQLNDPYNEGDTITVYQFSNHDSQGFERIKYDVVDRLNITTGTGIDSTVEDLKTDWYTIQHLRNGLVELRYPAVDAQYVWVTINGDLLMPSVDYYVTDNKRYVKIDADIDENDKLEIIHFAAPTTVNKFGWRQFKDILNRTHYKRLDGGNNFLLAQDLMWYDDEIVLEDVTNLPTPVANSNIPSVIFIEGERIEYFLVQDNKLLQIRRGTLGTGVKNSYATGTEVYPQGIENTVPYKDETLTTVFIGDETSTQFELDFVAQSVNEFEVFVAGRRLRKTSLDNYQQPISNTDNTVPTQLDSPEGDIVLAAEFEVTGNILTLLEPPGIGERIIIIRKQGKLWSDPGTTLGDTNNQISRFLRAKTVDLPR